MHVYVYTTPFEIGGVVGVLLDSALENLLKTVHGQKKVGGAELRVLLSHAGHVTPLFHAFFCRWIRVEAPMTCFAGVGTVAITEPTRTQFQASLRKQVQLW